MSSDDFDIKPPTPPSEQSGKKKKGLFSKLFGGKKHTDNKPSSPEQFSQTFDDIHNELEEDTSQADIADTIGAPGQETNPADSQTQEIRDKLGLNEQTPSTDHLYDHLEDDAKTSADKLSEQYDQEQADYGTTAEKQSASAWTETNNSKDNGSKSDYVPPEDTQNKNKIPGYLAELGKEEAEEKQQEALDDDSSSSDKKQPTSETAPSEKIDFTEDTENWTAGDSSFASDEAEEQSPSEQTSSWIQDGEEEQPDKKTTSPNSSWTADGENDTSTKDADTKSSSFTEDPQEEKQENLEKTSWAEDPQQLMSDQQATADTSEEQSTAEPDASQEEKTAEKPMAEEGAEEQPATKTDDIPGTTEDSTHDMSVGENEDVEQDIEKVTSDVPEPDLKQEAKEAPESAWTQPENGAFDSNDSKDDESTDYDQRSWTQPAEQPTVQDETGSPESMTVDEDTKDDEKQSQSSWAADDEKVDKQDSSSTLAHEDDVVGPAENKEEAITADENDDDKQLLETKEKESLEKPEEKENITQEQDATVTENSEEQPVAEHQHDSHDHDKEIKEFEEILKKKEEHLKSFYEKKLEEFRKWEKEQEKRIEEKRKEVEQMVENKAPETKTRHSASTMKLQQEIDELKASLKETNEELEDLEMKQQSLPVETQEKKESKEKIDFTADDGVGKKSVHPEENKKIPENVTSDAAAVEEALKEQDERINKLSEDVMGVKKEYADTGHQDEKPVEEVTGMSEEQSADNTHSSWTAQEEPETQQLQEKNIPDQNTVAELPENDKIAEELASMIDECKQVIASGNPVQAKDKYQQAREFYMKLNVSSEENEKRYYELKHLYEQIHLKLLEQEAILRLKGKI
ncbi:MAG: hypothetical protein ACQESE_02545 [Nanobdellota archaeon]